MKFLSFPQFDAGKMGDGDISKTYRDKLEQDLIDFRSSLTERNKRKSFRYRFSR